MKRILMNAALVGMLAPGSYAVAQTDQTQQSGQSAQAMQSSADSGYSNSGSSTKPETMKECMARQKSTNSGMTHEAMHTTCKNEMKQQKLHQQGQDLATGPQDSSQTQSRPQH
jgi:hypothetical protein